MNFKQTLAAGAAALAGGAMAQSAVNISGIVDAGYSRGNGSIASANQLTSGNISTSRLIISGQEDLGGGLAAGFWLESQFNTANGSGAATNTNNQSTGATAVGGLTFNRRASVSLLGNWGEIRLGRNAAAHFYDRWESDPFIAIGVGATQAFVSSLAGITGVRVSNAVSYFLPGDLGGAFGQVQYFFGQNPSNAANPHDGTGYALRAGWASGPIRVSVHRARTTYLATGDITTTGAAASYAMPKVKLLAGVFQDEVAAPANNTGRG